MKAFFSEDQLLHNARPSKRLGQLPSLGDLSAQPRTLLEVLQKRGVDIAAPPNYGREPLEAIHSRDYLDFLEQAHNRWMALAQHEEAGEEVVSIVRPLQFDLEQYSAGGAGVRPPCPSPSIVAQAGWYLNDLSVPINEHTWHAALRSAHCAIAAAEEIIERTTGAEGKEGPFTYALCYPPGHHVRRDSAEGFCFLNNVAMAAERLSRHFGNIAVMDIDAHHGDGTQQIFGDRADILTISIHADPINYFPFYTGYPHERGLGPGAGFNLNLPLPHGSDNSVFFAALEQALSEARHVEATALVLALGFNMLATDPASVLKLDNDAYREVGKRIKALALPTVIVQEGGYAPESIAAALEAFLDGLNSADRPVSETP